MLRFVLLSSLLTLGTSCGTTDADLEAAPPTEDVALEGAPTTVREADVVPAAPPVSNVLASAVPADTTEVDPATLDTFRSILEDAAAEDVASRPYGEIVQWVGEQLIGRPYVAGMLDAPANEMLVVDLTGFDCVLYVENVMALARMIALGESSYDAYADGIRTLRYRDGDVSYCSRLHYFTDWIRDNERRGSVENVTAAAGGERFDKQLTFMSEHRDSYRQLSDDSAYQCVVNMEGDLAGAELYYIPQDRIEDAYAMLQPGDVIATATSIGGLDVTHTGFVHKDATHTGFMHASLASNAVKVSNDLEDYVQGIRSQVGIVVARPLDPRG